MSDSNVSELASHLGFWLRFVSNHVSQAFARKVEAEGVTVAEWTVMRALHGEGGIAPSRIAERLGLTRGAISKLADRLIAKGLVGREASETDGRAHFLALTAAGEQLLPRLAALADRNDDEFFGHLTIEDREATLRILRDIVERRGLTAFPIG